MKKAAFIFSLIHTIIGGMVLFPLAWLIPMTIQIYKAYKGEKDLSLGFKICVLIFDSVLAGLFLLFSKE